MNSKAFFGGVVISPEADMVARELIHDNIFDNKTVPKHSETAQKFPLRPYLLRQNFGCWENEKTLKLQ